MTLADTNPTALTPDQITASRDRLIAEGFHSSSKAVRVHDHLIEAMRKVEGLCQVNERNVDSAWECMEQLKAECERLRMVYEAARGLCFGYDWNHGTHAKDHGY